MREIRKDPIHNRWVIIASNRENRPHAFYREEEEVGSKKECPFCEGKEKKTPPEIDSFRASGKPNEPGWKIRVVPNKFPALTSEGEPRKVYNGLYYKINGFGIQWLEFVDEIYTLNEKRVVEFCEAILSGKLSFQWGCGTRADRINEELVILMKKAGCGKIGFGIETGVERVRSAINKRITN